MDLGEQVADAAAELQEEGDDPEDPFSALGRLQVLLRQDAEAISTYSRGGGGWPRTAASIVNPDNLDSGGGMPGGVLVRGFLLKIIYSHKGGTINQSFQQVVVVLLCLILALAITCGILRLCKKEEHFAGEPTYSVAISNRLFKGRRNTREQFFSSFEGGRYILMELAHGRKFLARHLYGKVTERREEGPELECLACTKAGINFVPKTLYPRILSPFVTFISFPEC